MIKLLVITPYQSSPYEVICSTKYQAYNYMHNVYKNGGFAFHLNINFPDKNSSENVEYYTIKQHLEQVKEWQISYKNHDLIQVLHYLNMFEKMYQNQGINTFKELKRKPNTTKKIDSACA